MVTCDKMDLLHVGRLKNLFPSVVVNYVNNVYTTFLIHFMLIEKCGTLFTTLYWLYLMLAVSDMQVAIVGVIHGCNLKSPIAHSIS